MTSLPAVPSLVRSVLVALLLLSVGPAAAGTERVIDAAEAYAKSVAGEVTVIDVRSPGEWRETGVPAGAKLVTIHDPRGAEGFLANVLAAVEGDRTRPIALICARGTRSSRAYNFLARQGFTNLYNVREGMLGRGREPGWIRRGLPLAPCNC